MLLWSFHLSYTGLCVFVFDGTCRRLYAGVLHYFLRLSWPLAIRNEVVIKDQIILIVVP